MGRRRRCFVSDLAHDWRTLLDLRRARIRGGADCCIASRHDGMRSSRMHAPVRGGTPATMPIFPLVPWHWASCLR